MKKWEVTLTATAYTTVVVEAETAYEACEEARGNYRSPTSVKQRNISICSEWSLTEDEPPVEVAE